MVRQVQRRWIVALAAGTVLVGAATTVALAAHGSGPIDGMPAAAASAASGPAAATAAAVDTTGFPSGKKHTGIFTDRCGYSHEAADDPILAPGRPGTSMHHDFFGNTGTDAASSAAGLVGGTTTCSTSADASAYWIPVLYQNGTALRPSAAKIYWRQHNTLAAKVEPMPAGLTMIAGNESATSPQSRTIVQWSCKPGKGVHDKHQSSTPPSCASGGLKLDIFFPSCWDGHTLDGAQQTNVVYPSKTAGCPSSHPVEIPQVVFHTTYSITSTAGLSVSMTPTTTGSLDTEHADFMNGWTQSRLTADTEACIATQTRCGQVSGSAATPAGPKTNQPQKAQRQHKRQDTKTSAGVRPGDASGHR